MLHPYLILFICNGISTAFLLNYTIKYIRNNNLNSKDEKLEWLLFKITNLENQIQELNIKLDIKDSENELLNSKLESFIDDNYITS